MGYNWQEQMKRTSFMIMCLISFLLIGATSSAQTRTKISEGLYLVDYENVSDAGLVGVDQLSGNDIVVIFYLAQ